jgi:hypothetical protein
VVFGFPRLDEFFDHRGEFIKTTPSYYKSFISDPTILEGIVNLGQSGLIFYLGPGT